MKKIFITALALCLSLSGTASAFEITDIGPDTSFIDNIGRNVSADKKYLSDIAAAYKEKYVVAEEKYADISDIDTFYKELSAPVTLEELDSGSMKFGMPGPAAEACSSVAAVVCLRTASACISAEAA